MSSGGKTVRLKSGEEMAEALLRLVMGSLRDLADNHSLVLADLVKICRDPEYVSSEFSRPVLESLDLVQVEDGQVTIKDYAKSIVLAAVEGEGFDLQIRSPLAAD